MNDEPSLPVGIVDAFDGPAVKRACANCPFVREAQGKGYLHRARMLSIKWSVALGMPFYCHKTVYSSRSEMTTTDDGDEVPPIWEPHYRMCRGALDWFKAYDEELKANAETLR